MERTKELLTLAPFVAVIIATSYLQGYWGAFEILAFPYLGFQELLAYSAAPFFGFVASALVGMSLSAIDYVENRGKQKSRLIRILEDLMFLTFCAALIYLKMPERWLVVPVVLLSFVTPTLLRTQAAQAFRENQPQLAVSVLIIVFLVIGSFGYGRTQAERLIRETPPTADITVDSGREAIRMIGKLGTYYFFLNSAHHVSVIPEQAVKRLEYRKEVKGG